MLISEQQEIQMGAEADPQIVAAFGLYPDDKLQAFINEKGQKMAKISHRPNLKYEFKILDSPVVNAFAVPGGYVYFTRGILANFNNEAEFAGVLGHEIGHITARHTARAQSKQLLFQAGFIAGLIVSPEFAQFADVGEQALGLLFLKFGRDHETESDELGVDYSTQIGYDAHKMADFFGTLKRIGDESGSEIPTFLSTHPDPGNRFNKVHDHATEAQASLDKSKLQVNRDSYLRMIDGMVYGEDPRQGFFENNVFYHPELKFQFPVPTNWATQNSPQDVRMAPQNGKALMILSLAQGNSLDAAAQAVVENNGLTVIDSKKQTVNGYPALIMLADQVNPQDPQQVIRLLTYLIQDGSTIYKFHGLAMKNDYNSYSSLFTNTMSGFKKLTDQSKINKQPERLKVASVPHTGTVQQAFQALKVPSNRMDEFAILNSVELKDQVQAGSLIKVLK
jgi:predicted Zn-dependent protease